MKYLLLVIYIILLLFLWLSLRAVSILNWMDIDEIIKEWWNEYTYYLIILNIVVIIFSIIFSKISLNKDNNKKALIISFIPIFTIIPFILFFIK